MIRCSEYYGIQFVQGHYLMHWESREFASIVDKLFVHDEPISVAYAGLGSASGHDAVRKFFSDIRMMSEQNGGLLRLDMPLTQWIHIDPDRTHATGEWDTMTYRIHGAAFGNDRKVAPLDYAIGHYTNRYACEDGIWKLVSISWEPSITFGNWETTDATAIYRRPFQKPYELLRPVDDASASPATFTNLQVRQAALEFFHDYNRVGLSAIDSRFSEDAAREARRMLTAPCSAKEFHGVVLASSPIVAVDADLNRGQLYLCISNIQPVSDTQIAHSRGRVCAELVRCKDGWQFSDFRWYRYATMDPWDVREVYTSQRTQ